MMASAVMQLNGTKYVLSSSQLSVSVKNETASKKHLFIYEIKRTCHDFYMINNVLYVETINVKRDLYYLFIELTFISQEKN